MPAPSVFVSYDLRTTDLDDAADFYADVLGFTVRSAGEPGSAAFFAGERRVGALSALPERARALGAPAHWLGIVGVDEVEAFVARFVARGGAPLGPVGLDPEGRRVASLRDPDGAVVGLRARRDDDTPMGVAAWHELNTTDAERALTTYSELFGWEATGSLDLGAPLGTYRRFAWSPGGVDVGGVVETARLPGVHTHWLFYFDVDDLEGALAKVRARGGKVIGGPRPGPSGDRVAPCEDAQGAAFALRG